MQVFLMNLTVVEWLNSNYWWPVLLFIASIIIIIRILLMRPKKTTKVTSSEYNEEVIKNLGGISNIVSSSLDGNRVKFQVQQIELANLEAFKEIGATGVFISGKNVKMVLPFNAQDLVDKINIDINGGQL